MFKETKISLSSSEERAFAKCIVKGRWFNSILRLMQKTEMQQDKTCAMTWQEVVKCLFKGEAAQISPSSRIVTIAQMNGIGNPVSRQKTVYSQADLFVLKKIFDCFIILDNFFYISNQHLEIQDELIQRFLSAVTKKEEIIFFVVFCPSYKKGVNQFGYNNKVGESTKNNLLFIKKFIENLNKIDIKFKLYLFFSDLILENYQKLKGGTYKKDLNANYRSFKKFINLNFKSFSRYVFVSKLSKEKKLKVHLGEIGLTSNSQLISEEQELNLIHRHKLFYGPILGWNDEQIIDRTKTIIASYNFLGDFFNSKFDKKGVMIWTESFQERAFLFNIQKRKNIILFKKNV